MREQSSVDRRIHVQMKQKVILKEAKAAQAAWGLSIFYSMGSGT